MNVTEALSKVYFKRLFYRLIRLIDFSRSHFCRIIRFNVSESCMLIKMSSESISCMIKSFITCAYETASFYYVMSVIESWCGKIIIIRMYFKPFKRINWSDCMLPNISYNIIESFILKQIHWIRWYPVL